MPVIWHTVTRNNAKILIAENRIFQSVRMITQKYAILANLAKQPKYGIFMQNQTTIWL